ncbi:MAG: carboxypeptidase-like regulatory domain-containing protein [Melioribacteraceae bacterium]|nr:carboxypeptidase-like regulatory domain-containing protein [Melioribacteraceae bacterium]
MSITKKFVLLVYLLFVFSNISAQTQTISGFISDKENGESLIGANIILKEISIGASTNISGYFVIPNIPYGNYTLIVSYMGYQPQRISIKIGKKTLETLKLQLTPTTLKTGEVVVSADSIRIAEKLFSKPISKINLTQTQVNAIPKVVEADLLRALQTMPGITALSDFSSALYVRGGTPDQNLYLIDGTDVYNPEHAFGIFSTFNTNAIKRVEVSKGGFDASYGGRLSSVLDVTNVDGNRNDFEGVFNLSLISASTTLQMPLGSIGSISGSIRRTYLDQTYSKVIDDIPDYYFYDGNLKAYFDFNDNNKLSISFFKSQDALDFQLDEDSKDSFGFLYDWGNLTGSINYKYIFSPQLFSSFWFTASRFSSNFDMSNIMNMSEDNILSDYALKGALEYYASNNFNLRFGIEHKLLHGVYKQNWDEGKVDIDQRRQYTSAYLTSNWKPGNHWDIETGLRFNRFKTDENIIHLDPRLTIKYRLSEESNLKFATGIYHQYLNRIPRLFFSSIWTTADEFNKESSSTHFIFGYQREVGQIYEFEIETYYKTYDNIHTFNQLFGAEVTPAAYDNRGKAVYNSTENLFNTGKGHSYGVEVLLRKDIGALTGWISYALSRTNYTYNKINHGNEFIPRHDRSSVVNFVLNTDITSLWNGNYDGSSKKGGSKWMLGLSFIYATGQPITVPTSAYYTNTLPDWNQVELSGENNPSYNLYPGDINSYRLPGYTRLDLSLTYEKDYGNWSISPYLQIFNIGNRKNVWFIDYQEELSDGSIIQKVDETNMLPILPSLGVTIKF